MTELNPCPYPKCKSVLVNLELKSGKWGVACADCGYRATPGESKDEAAEKHNLISPPRWIPVEESLPGIGENCETWGGDGQDYRFMWLDRTPDGRTHWTDGTFRWFLDETEDEQRITHWRKQTIPHPPRKP